MIAAAGVRRSRDRAAFALATTLAAMTAAATMAACGGAESEAPASQDENLTAGKAKVAETLSIGLREASGLGVRRRSGDAVDLLAVGDRDAAVALLDAGKDEFEVAALADVLPEGSLSSEEDAQWEAVAADGAGRVFVLRENPPTLWAFDSKLGKVLRTVALDASDDDVIGKDWKKDVNSRGEGLVLLRSGHVLILKEKSPPALVEFGPEGDAPSGYSEGDAATDSTFPLPSAAEATFVALRTWLFSDKTLGIVHDASDLAVGPDGALYLLSDESRLVARLEGTLRVDEDRIALKKTWKLPSKVEKPEGLAFLPDGRPVVAGDTSRSTDNAFVLESLE